MLKVLSIYRGQIADHRGTPIRVRSLLTQVNQDERVELTVASWDKTLPNFKHHLFLSNNHWEDLKKLRRYVRENKIDVVLGHTNAVSYYLVPLKFLTNAKIVLEAHGFIEEEGREYGDIGRLKYYLFKMWHWLLYQMCDLIFTCSDTATALIARYNKNTHSLYGGINPNIFNIQVESGKYLQKDGRIIIGYAGNTRRWQGVDFLVEVFHDLVKEYPEFRLAMLLSEQKNVPAGAEIFGPVSAEEVPKFLIDCDILVIPRPNTAVTRISFPSKIPEYLAMGKAIVASNIGDANTVITNGENGLLYTPGNAAELRAALLVLRDSILREKLGAAAAATAQKFTWDKVANKLVDSLSKLCLNKLQR